MKSVAMLAFVFVIGGFVGAGSMPARHSVVPTTGQAWGAAVSTMAKTTPGMGVHVRAMHSQAPQWVQAQ